MAASHGPGPGAQEKRVGQLVDVSCRAYHQKSVRHQDDGSEKEIGHLHFAQQNKDQAAPMNLLETGDAKTSTTPIKKRQQPVNHTSQIEIVRRHNVDHQQQQQLQYTCEQMETFGYGQRNEDDFATGIGSNRRSPPPSQELHDGKAQERRQPSNVVTSQVVVFGNSPGRRRTQCGDGNSLPNESTTSTYVSGDCVCHAIALTSSRSGGPAPPFVSSSTERRQRPTRQAAINATKAAVEQLNEMHPAPSPPPVVLSAPSSSEAAAAAQRVTR